MLFEFAFFLSLEVMLKIPTTFTRLPGVHLSVRCLSQVSMSDLGISPVGMSSGASCSFKIYWSMNSHLSVAILYGLRPQFGLSIPALFWFSHTAGAMHLVSPILTSCVFSCPQFVHFQTQVLALTDVLLVEVIIPGIVTIFPIR